MHRDSQGQQPGTDGAPWLATLLQVLEISVVVFLRRRFGERYFRWRPLAVPPVVLFFGSLFPEEDQTPLLYFLAFWFMGLCRAQHDLAQRRKVGDLEHSYYGGFPDLMRGPWGRRLEERMVKARIEPLLVAAAGASIQTASRPLGMYLLLASFAMILCTQLAQWAEREQLMDLRDAQIRQRGLAERLRRGHWRG